MLLSILSKDRVVQKDKPVSSLSGESEAGFWVMLRDRPCPYLCGSCIVLYDLRIEEQLIFKLLEYKSMSYVVV